MSETKKEAALLSVRSNVELGACPCGKIPESLGITEGSNDKWGYVYGHCCEEWSIEFRTQYNPLHSDECMTLAIKEWNRAPRAPNIQ